MSYRSPHKIKVATNVRASTYVVLQLQFRFQLSSFIGKHDPKIGRFRLLVLLINSPKLAPFQNIIPFLKGNNIFYN